MNLGSRHAAALLTVLVIVALLTPCPSSVRAVLVLAFWAWVPGAIVVSLAGGTGQLRPSAPALGVGVALFVLIAQLELLLHLPAGRDAMVADAGGALLVLLAWRPQRSALNADGPVSSS